MEQIRARIIRSHQREFDCRLEQTSEVVKATALGNLFKKGETLVVGDNVLISTISETGEYVIEKVLERKNEIYRILVRESKKKVTASNIDYLIILSSSHRPKFKRGIIDRFLVRACQWGIRPLIVFNKMDKYDGEDFDIEYEVDRLKNLGVECFEVSALEPEYKPQFLENGFEQFRERLKGSTSLFLGQSGVGKSKTISALSQGEVELKTKSVGKVGKGSHTTTWSEIIDLGDFFLVDSPGIRSFSIDDIDPDDLLEFFPDVEEIATRCKFSTCTHLPDNKGCAFYTAEYDPDEYEGLLVHSRLEAYLHLKDEISNTPFWKKNKKYS